MPMIRNQLPLPLLTALLGAALLASCGDKHDDRDAKPDDPALSNALADPIMTDPDLTRQSQAHAAIVRGAGGALSSGDLPPEQPSADAASAARSDALALVGGSLLALPTPAATNSSNSGALPGNTEDLLRRLAGGAEKCAASLQNGFGWAAKMPTTFPIYPRGHVSQAAGSDQANCHVRAITYVSSVSAPDVLSFYYTRAHSAGITVEYTIDGNNAVLKGGKGAAAFLVTAHPNTAGMTEVQLATRAP